jgi:hypothetical protein
MLSGMSLLVPPLLALAIAGHSQTCQELDAKYQANMDAVFDATHAYEDCIAAGRGPQRCGVEIDDLETAQERVQAAFLSYLRVCGSRMADKETGRPACLRPAERRPS